MEVNYTTVRIFLHILAASVWVGGQITLTALLPVLRQSEEDDLPKKVARQFNKIAWPAYGLAVITGIWNLSEVDLADRSNGYHVAVMLKLLVVAAAGVGAWLHTTATSRSALAVWGAVGGVASLLAMLFGAILVTSF